MDFYENCFEGIQKFSADFDMLYELLQDISFKGVHVQTVSPEQVSELERIIRDGVALTDKKFIYDLVGMSTPAERQERHPFVQFCSHLVGSPFVLGNYAKDVTTQFVLIPKNLEDGIEESQMECLQNYWHFDRWRDSTKYYGKTIFTPETMFTVLEQALPHFDKFYVSTKPALYQHPDADNEWAMKLNARPQTRDPIPMRREEISRTEMEILIGMQQKGEQLVLAEI